VIYLTENARKKLSNNISNLPEGNVVKIGIKKSGCSGYAYVIEYLEVGEIENEVRYDIDGIDIYIDPSHNVFLSDMTIDFRKTGLNELFEFINPNESARCGCGESFTI